MLTNATKFADTNSSASTAANVEFGLRRPVAIKTPHLVIRFLNQLNALMGRKAETTDVTYTAASGTDPMDSTSNKRFFQSQTQKLAFGGYTGVFPSSATEEEKKAKNLSNFYNNSTLSWIAKIFSVCVLICAFLMLIREVVYGS